MFNFCLYAIQFMTITDTQESSAETAMERLKPTERHFFSLVHQAVYANPFSDRRGRVDLEIAGFFAGTDEDRGFQKTISQVRAHIGRLENGNRADITRYGEADRKVLTSSFSVSYTHLRAHET